MYDLFITKLGKVDIIFFLKNKNAELFTINLARVVLLRDDRPWLTKEFKAPHEPYHTVTLPVLNPIEKAYQSDPRVDHTLSLQPLVFSEFYPCPHIPY